MSDADDKLSALEAILGVDDTEELSRPPAKRSVGEILSGGAETDDEVSEPVQADDPGPSYDEVIQNKRRDAPVTTPVRPAATSRPASRSPKVRTSSLLPVDFLGRFEAARERRWSLAGLVEAALERDTPSEREAEEVLEAHEGAPRTLRSFSLPGETMAALDGIGELWRMNRSQVLTVLLDLEFHKQGF